MVARLQLTPVGSGMIAVTSVVLSLGMAYVPDVSLFMAQIIEARPIREAFVETVRKIGLFDQLSTIDVYELAKMINRGELNAELKKLLDPFITETDNTYVRLSRK